MTPGEREKMNGICARIQTEKDPETFDRLVQELNDLIAVASAHEQYISSLYSYGPHLAHRGPEKPRKIASSNES